MNNVEGVGEGEKKEEWTESCIGMNTSFRPYFKHNIEAKVSRIMPE